MKLILRNHTEEYAAREIIAAYIPRVKIEVSENAENGEDCAVSEVTENTGVFEYRARLLLHGREYCGFCTADAFSKTFVKKALSAALSDATGISLPWGLITGIRPSKMVRELDSEGKSREQIERIFKEHYLCDSDKIRLAADVAYREKSLIATMPQNSVSLYIGIPFCPTRCLYCSFTSQSVEFSNKLTEPYMDALCKEMRATAEIARQKDLKIDTVYIGGGTPTSLTEKQLSRLLTELYTDFDLPSMREITLEAGRPDTINEEKLKIISDFGISRISINPQTMNQKTLDVIGRRHTPNDIVRTYETAVRMGFNHINTDLIAGLPGESAEDFAYTLSEVGKLNPKSVTVHTMCVKRGSYLDKFYDMYTPSAAETVNEMLKNAAQSMAALDKKPYYMYRQKNMLGNLENVGYCDDGHECLYNVYIMEEVQSILAVGAGASTKIINGDRIDRIFNVKEVSEYIKRIDEMIERKDILKGDMI